MLLGVLDIGPDVKPSPRAIVVGPKCERAVRSLLLFLNGPEAPDNAGNVFQNLDAAWAYVDAQIK